jgi:hypothetical protein
MQHVVLWPVGAHFFKQNLLIKLKLDSIVGICTERILRDINYIKHLAFRGMGGGGDTYVQQMFEVLFLRRNCFGVEILKSSSVTCLNFD